MTITHAETLLASDRGRLRLSLTPTATLWAYVDELMQHWTARCYNGREKRCTLWSRPILTGWQGRLAVQTRAAGWCHMSTEHLAIQVQSDLHALQPGAGPLVCVNLVHSDTDWSYRRDWIWVLPAYGVPLHRVAITDWTSSHLRDALEVILYLVQHDHDRKYPECWWSEVNARLRNFRRFRELQPE